MSLVLGSLLAKTANERPATPAPTTAIEMAVINIIFKAIDSAIMNID